MFFIASQPIIHCKGVIMPIIVGPVCKMRPCPCIGHQSEEEFICVHRGHWQTTPPEPVAVLITIDCFMLVVKAKQNIGEVEQAIMFYSIRPEHIEKFCGRISIRHQLYDAAEPCRVLDEERAEFFVCSRQRICRFYCFHELLLIDNFVVISDINLLPAVSW